jgi:hypothetical protein
MSTKSRKPSRPIISRIKREQIVRERNIPIPEEIPTKRSVFPFHELEPGDSFSFPALHDSSHAQRQLSSVILSSRQYAKNYEPQAKFIARLDGSVIRVWRTANNPE